MSAPVSPIYPQEQRLRVDLELTNACNFKCPICPQAFTGDRVTEAGAPYNRRTGMMSPEVFERSVEECERVAGWVELGFFGEQTLHRRYFDYLDRLGRRESFALELNTNLSLVTRETLAKWIEVRLDLARLSVDAVTPEVFNRARPGQVRDLDGNIVDEADRMDAINEKIDYWLGLADHCPTRLVFVKSSHNTGERLPFVERWRPRLGPEDVVLLKQMLSYGGKMADPAVRAHACNIWNERYLMIDWRGDLSPCNLDTNMDLAIGNVMRDSLHGAYRGAIANHLRSRTGCGKDLTPCRTCVDANNWSENEFYKNAAHHPEEALNQPPADAEVGHESPTMTPATAAQPL
ncbi:radical SAM protein [Engelhardtia mirabilis]|uniref:Radical SAM superfamily protein n=1 Tax=Engelhardtia mirabilis TaxID=2528011 RepID=A0A518BIU4_9BACT|nr:Radical SAM superfamily protein [Planctomycetes bacterium Pla133]QDV01213.1 Radical SAM superfamily protein [Planctomycetes bacterium Pla86]